MGEDVREIWKEYFKDLYDVDTEERTAVNIYGFDGSKRGNYFEVFPMRTKVKLHVKMFKSRRKQIRMRLPEK